MNRSTLLLWCFLGFIVAIVLGRVAAWLYMAGAAPVVVTSVALGAGVGVGAGMLATYLGVRCGRSVVVGALMFSLVAAVAQHAWLYGDFRRQWRESRESSPQVAMFRSETPWSPAEYFAHELSPAKAALWAFDAILVVAAAVAASLLATRNLRRQCDRNFPESTVTNP